MMAATEARGYAAAAGPRADRCACCGAPKAAIRRDRRFTLMDAMILVAASALSSMIVRWLFASEPRSFRATWVRYLVMLIAGLATWTPTALFLKLRAPRPRRSRLSRQPDFVASLAATSILALGVLAYVILAIVRAAREGLLARMQRQTRMPLPARPPDPYWWMFIVIQIGAVVGVAVIGAWVVLAISGRRRPSRGWLDLLGRGVGAAWIFVFVAGCCARLGFLRD